MTIEAYNKRRGKIILFASVLFIVLFTIGNIKSVIVNLNDKNIKKVSKDIEDKKKELLSMQSKIDEASPNLKNITMYQRDTKLFKENLEKRIRAFIKQRALKAGYTPFDIKVRDISRSPKYYDVLIVDIQFTQVDWIFGVEHGKEIAKDLLVMAVDENLEMNDKIIGKARFKNPSTVTMFIKLTPLKEV